MDDDDADCFDWMDCPDCEGSGTVHDCGEDCCPCLRPELSDQVACSTCDGRGGWREPLLFGDP